MRIFYHIALTGKFLYQQVGSFLLTVAFFYLQLPISFFAYSWSSFAYSFSFSTYSWSFFAYSGKMHLIRALWDCKQRSLTVSKKAPTGSEKASPAENVLRASQNLRECGLYCVFFVFALVLKGPRLRGRS